MLIKSRFLDACILGFIVLSTYNPTLGIQNKGKVVTKTMLLERLWDIDGNFVDDNTIRVNIKRLRQKLNDEKQEYIVTVFGMGYTFGE